MIQLASIPVKFYLLNFHNNSDGGLYLDGVLISSNQNYTGNIDFNFGDGLFLDDLLITTNPNYTGNINFGV